MRGVLVLFCSMAFMTTVGSILEVGAVQRQVWTTSFCRSLSAAATSQRRMTSFASLLSPPCNDDINGGRLLRRRRHIPTSFHKRQRCCWGISPLRPRQCSSLLSHPSKASTARRGTSLGSKALNDIVKDTLLNEILPKCYPCNEGDSSSAGCRRVTAVIGVSGGCDSIALLHVLHDLVNHSNAKDYDWHLAVAHFDHQQRGAASDGDREFVVDLCRQLQIDVHCYYWSDYMSACIAATGKTPPFSQDAARQWRRQTMQALLLDCIGAPENAAVTADTDHGRRPQERGCGLLLTAHHKDDSEETLLLKLLRGAHISNLSGLTACTPIVNWERIGEGDDLDVGYTEMEDESLQDVPTSSTGARFCCWARPFIHVCKSDLVEYLQDRGLTWRDDASNQSDKYLRNRVRNELLPLLTDLVGNGNNDRDVLSRRLEHLSEQATDVREHLHRQAQQYFDAHVDTSTGTFALPLQNDGSARKVVRFDVTSKQALHLWLTRQSSSSSLHQQRHSFAYSHVRRIVRQVEDYSNRQVWRLCLGNGWNVHRHGNVLHLVRDDDITMDSTNAVASAVAEDVGVRVAAWRPLDDNEAANNDEIEIALPVRLTHTAFSFVQSKVGHGPFARGSSGGADTFTPPWRSRPIRLVDFLRGQQVPLHLRHQAMILVMQQEQQQQRQRQTNEKDESTLGAEEARTTTVVVAVYVVTKKKWIVDASFALIDNANAAAVQTRVAVAVNV